MQSAERRAQVPAERVWDVLADGWTYPLWVVGASRMRAVSADWPGVGAQLHHSAGLWPALLNDETVVQECEPGRRLVLVPKGRPFGSAVVEITLEPQGETCLVRMKEDVISGPAKLIPGPLRQAASVVRNRETLHRLLLLIERNTTP